MGCGHSSIYPRRKNKSQAATNCAEAESEEEGEETEAAATAAAAAAAEADKRRPRPQHLAAPPGPLLAHAEVSSSQLDFFKMLDEKIENGPDYDFNSEEEIAQERARLNNLLRDWESASISVNASKTVTVTTGQRKLPSVHQVRQQQQQQQQIQQQQMMHQQQFHHQQQQYVHRPPQPYMYQQVQMSPQQMYHQKYLLQQRQTYQGQPEYHSPQRGYGMPHQYPESYQPAHAFHPPSYQQPPPYHQQHLYQPQQLLQARIQVPSQLEPGPRFIYQQMNGEAYQQMFAGGRPPIRQANSVVQYHKSRGAYTELA